MSKDKKTKEEISSALLSKSSQLIKAQKEELSNVTPHDNELIKDSEEDYKFTRENIRKLISTTDQAIAILLGLAEDSEHPRAFEVLANLIRTQSDVNNQLIDIQKDRKKLIKGEGKTNSAIPVSGNIENQQNVIFAGTTADLQKFLKKNSKEENE